jgi:hypothetical protein
MDPYYAAALALYRVDVAFRGKKIDPKLKPARFHILLATRILIAGYERPSFTADKMEGYCKPLTDLLQNSTKAEMEILKAAALVEAAANGNFSSR